MHTNIAEIATSAAVVEFKLLLLITSILLTLLSYNYLGIFIILLSETIINSSVESVIAIYGSIGWIIIIEITLFCGFLFTTWIILITVIFKTWYFIIFCS